MVWGILLNVDLLTLAARTPALCTLCMGQREVLTVHKFSRPVVSDLSDSEYSLILLNS